MQNELRTKRYPAWRTAGLRNVATEDVHVSERYWEAQHQVFSTSVSASYSALRERLKGAIVAQSGPRSY